MIPYTAPAIDLSSFNCPVCNAYANQIWEQVGYFSHGDSGGTSMIHIQGLKVVRCYHCNEYSVWHWDDLIYPDLSTAPLPNPDLDDGTKADYMEARSIVNKSPRGAAALLRLCVQKLCKQLGEPGKNINDDIGALV